MDFNELNDDRKLINQSLKVDNYINRGFSESARSTVTNYAIFGGIALALPLVGIDNLIYIVCLWGMYAKLCSLAKKSFGSNMSKSFIGAFIVNIIVSGIIEVLVSWIPVAGWIMSFLIGYFSIKISGAAYLKALELLHNGNVAERYNFNRNN